MDDIAQKKQQEYRILVIDDTKSIHHDFQAIFDLPEPDKKGEQLENMLFGEVIETPQYLSEISHIQIDSACSGEDGIERIKQSLESNHPYAVAIVDVRMPGGLDGVETASKIFEIESNIQIVLCTAYADYNWEDMMIMLKHSDRWMILKKPFDVIEVRQLATSLCIKWSMLMDLKGQISSQTQALREKIEALNTAQDEIKRIAYYDSLTDLPNRLFFKEMLEKDIREANRNNKLLGLLFIDIDDFKKINDAYGHQMGDELLMQVAKQLESLLRQSDLLGRQNLGGHQDAVASRLGGDEFTVIVKDLNDQSDIIKIAKRIIECIAETAYSLYEQEVHTTVSIGVSIYPLDAMEADVLLKYADIAMYQAKTAGKNQVVVHDKKLNDVVVQKNILEQDIYQALKKQEFFLEYQPMILLKDQSIIGCEALIRWNHPQKGRLMPDNFIPIAEESGLIAEIDKYVLAEVCRQISEWKTTGLFENKTISINLSVKFFNTTNNVQIIKNLLEKYHVHPRDIEIEITESQIMQPRKKVINSLRELHHLFGDGIKIALDDFGMGYSSLNYISQFPFDSLKIAPSFIKEVEVNKQKQAIVNAIIALSHSLDHEVTAEGVETKSQYQYLSHVNCDAAQGFLMASSMPPEKLIEFVKQWNANIR